MASLQHKVACSTSHMHAHTARKCWEIACNGYIYSPPTSVYVQAKAESNPSSTLQQVHQD